MGFSRCIHLVLGVGLPTAKQASKTLALTALRTTWLKEAILEGALELVAWATIAVGSPSPLLVVADTQNSYN